MMMKKVRANFVKYPFFIGLSIRILLTAILPILLDDGFLLGGVKYTDIDYGVYIDAATLIQRGQSPYDRHTYRYTPFLASILAWGGGLTNMRWFGRIVFCIADALCGQILSMIRKEERESHVKWAQKLNVASDHKQQSKPKLKMYEDSDEVHIHVEQTNVRTPTTNDWIDALWWLYNPLPINICTRGSAESFMVLLPVLLTVMIAITDSNWISLLLPFRRRSKANIIVRAGVCGIIHGIAIHSKLYPIIYTPSFMAYFSRESSAYDSSGEKIWNAEDGAKNNMSETRNDGNASVLSKTMNFIYLWIRRILLPAPIVFLSHSMFLFFGLTFLGAQLYGKEALDEGLLYHFSRLDHRHNYSIYWYGIYLARYREFVGMNSSHFLPVLSRVLFFPQIILLFQCSMVIAPYDLTLALFLQTYIFVVFNKVITGQYFTWYLCLLPLCATRIRWTSRDMNVAFILVGVSIGCWLGSAFCLEMKEYSIHKIVWMASLFVFGASLNLLRVILLNYEKTSMLKNNTLITTQAVKKGQ